MNNWLQFGLPDYVPPGTCFTGAEIIAAGTLAATAISTGVSYIGAQQQASAQADAAKYQQAVAENNRIIADQNAAQERQTAQAETEAQGLKNAADVGRIRAAQGASGIDPETGSPADVVGSAREFQRLDLMNLVHNAELRARGQEQRGRGFTAQADLSGMEARNARLAGNIRGGTILGSGLSSLGAKWAEYTKPPSPTSGGGPLYGVFA